MEHIEPFSVIGIAIQTTNANGKAAMDLGKLWDRFFKENIPRKISNKVSDEIYSIYTDYASDYNGEYKVIIGLKVADLNEIPEGLIGQAFDGGKYQRFIAKGNMPEAVVNVWEEIWKNDSQLNRKYTADFEVYGPKSQDGENSEVEIFIAQT